MIIVQEECASCGDFRVVSTCACGEFECSKCKVTCAICKGKRCQECTAYCELCNYIVCEDTCSEFCGTCRLVRCNKAKHGFRIKENHEIVNCVLSDCAHCREEVSQKVTQTPTKKAVDHTATKDCISTLSPPSPMKRKANKDFDVDVVTKRSKKN